MLSYGVTTAALRALVDDIILPYLNDVSGDTLQLQQLVVRGTDDLLTEEQLCGLPSQACLRFVDLGFAQNVTPRVLDVLAMSPLVLLDLSNCNEGNLTEASLMQMFQALSKCGHPSVQY